MPEEEVPIVLWIDFDVSAVCQLSRILTHTAPGLTQHAS